MKKITVVGSLNSDLSICTPQLPKMGETVIGSDFQMLPGGKGLNQAIAAAKLGANVAMIGAVGQDDFGMSLLTFLKNHDVDTKGIVACPDQATGCAIITIFESDNSIILAEGANGCVTAEMIDDNQAIIAASSAVIMQLEIPLPAIREVLAITTAHQIPVIFNPAPMRELDATLLAQIQTIVVNEHECEQLTGIAVQTQTHAQAAIAWFQTQGIETAIITLGSRGVYFNTQGQTHFLPAQKVEAIDTTGAGDTFIGAYTAAIIEGQAVNDAVAFAVAASAITVTRRGAATAMPNRNEVQR